MKKAIIFCTIVTCFTFSQFAKAALPPKYQNLKDMRVMVNFIEAHPEIAWSLKSPMAGWAPLLLLSLRRRHVPSISGILKHSQKNQRGQIPL